MQATVEDQQIIVRGSPEHEEYLNFQHGKTKERVNKFESTLAISSRVLLIIYVIYTTVRATVAPALPQNPVVLYVLLGVDALMLTLQSLGLEGSRPGLIHLAQEMEEKGKTKEAEKLLKTSDMVQWLMCATAVDIVLNAILVGVTNATTDTSYGLNLLTILTVIVKGYSYTLLVVRVFAVGKYLGDMAKLSHKGPKIISKHEAEKQAKEKEQEQIRIDNRNIMVAVEKGIETWAKPMVEAVKSGLENQMQQVFTQLAEERAAMKAQLEAMQLSNGSALSLAEIGRQVDASTQEIMRQVDTKLSTSIETLTHDVIRQVHASVSTSTVDYDALTRLVTEKIDASQKDLMRQIDAKLDASGGTSSTVRQSSQKQAAKNASNGSARDTDKVVAINTMTRAAFFAAFDEKPELLNLSSYKLAEYFRDKNATEPTARRAKNEYLEAHPDLKTVAM